MTITLKELIEWRDALEPLSHLKPIDVDGKRLPSEASAAACFAHSRLHGIVSVLAEKVEANVEA